MAVQPVIMPKLGAYTEDVLLGEWLAEEGDEVVAGTVVLEMETDKTTADVEAETSGWLHRLVPAGEKVPIGTRVGLIADTREQYEAILAGDWEDPEPANPFLGYISQGGGTAAAETASAAQSASSAGPHTPPVGGEVPRRVRSDAPLVSPRARGLLERLGFSVDDAREIAGSGPGGRITDRDVTAWAEGRAAKPRSDVAADSSGLTVQRTIPLRGRRGTIAERMVSSLQTAAQLTSVLELDVKPLVELRARLNEAGAAPRIGITAIVVKLVVRVSISGGCSTSDRMMSSW